MPLNLICVVTVEMCFHYYKVYTEKYNSQDYKFYTQMNRIQIA